MKSYPSRTGELERRARAEERRERRAARRAGKRETGQPDERERALPASGAQAMHTATALADEIEAELLRRPATLEDLEHLRMAYGVQARIEARMAVDRRARERQQEHAAVLDEAMAREELWQSWQNEVRFFRRSKLSPRAKSNIINRFGLANYYRLKP